MNKLATILLRVAPIATAAKKPNILVTVSDDQGYADTGFQGCKGISTPHLDRLARSGRLHRADELYNFAAQHPDEVKRLETIFRAQWTPNTEYPMYPPKKKAK